MLALLAGIIHTIKQWWLTDIMRQNTSSRGKDQHETWFTFRYTCHLTDMIWIMRMEIEMSDWAYQHRRATMRHTNKTRSLFIIFPRGPTSSLFGVFLISHGFTIHRRQVFFSWLRACVSYKLTNNCLLWLRPILEVCWLLLCGPVVRFLFQL